jgi:nitrite reductase/ring-hydroxylating ferredoxin subunit
MSDGNPNDQRPWLRIIAMDQVRPGMGRYVETHGRALAVFRDDDGDGVTVLDDACPHAGASLSGGAIADGCVICPRHGWMFDLRTGRCPDNPEVGAAFYPARVRDGYVEAALPAQP